MNEALVVLVVLVVGNCSRVCHCLVWWPIVEVGGSPWL